MNKKIIKITFIAMMLSMMLPVLSWAKPAVPEPTESFYVNDFANVIDVKAENYMVNYGEKLHQETGAQVESSCCSRSKRINIGHCRATGSRVR